MAGNLEHALAYAAEGYRVFPLFYVVKGGLCSCRSKKPCKRIGKHPMTQNGVQDATVDDAQIRQWWTETPWANIGLATGHGGLIVVDVDDGLDKRTGRQKVGSASLAELTRAHGELSDTREVKTGSGGRHLYFYSTREITNSASRVAKDIDIRGYGGYVILPPSNHETGGKYEWVDRMEPAAMPEWLEKLAMGSTGISPEMLCEDSPRPDNPAALDAMESRLTTDQLIRLLDFIPPDCDRETWWQVGTALKKELGDKKGFEAWDAWSKKDSKKYDPKVMPVQWDSFDVNRKGVNGKAITAGTIFHFAKTIGEFRGFDKEAADAPELRDEWVFVTGIKRFVHVGKLIEWDKEQFDAEHAPMFNRGKPSEHVLKNPAFRRVTDATYWPEQPVFVTEKGRSKLNYWRQHDLTSAPGAVDPFLDHLRYLYPDPEESNILLRYLAHQVQRPGEKVHWAVLLVGDPGVGKSYFAEVMRRVLGPNNVKMVANETLHETFTGWQRNTQLIVVEELMARERLELMDKLKPMITESWCQIREMYRPPYDQPNRFNFLFFSNHDNALILDAKDRRYCVLKTEAEPRPHRYYSELFDWTRRNAGALLWHLKNEVDLSEFLPKAHAPMSNGKRQMILDTMPDLDRFIHSMVESREKPFDWNLQKISDLAGILPEYGFRVNANRISESFKRLGYLWLGRVKMPNQEGDVQKVNLWAVREFDLYKDMTADQLRRMWLLQTNGIVGEASEDTEKRLHEKMAKRRPRNETRENMEF